VDAVVTGIMAVLGSSGEAAPEALPPSPPSPPPPPLITALADLWGPTSSRAGEGWRQRFTGHVLAGGRAALWEAGNRAARRVPDPGTYIEKRRHTGAIYVCMDLVEVLHGIDVPDEAYADGVFQSALAAACDVVCWTNDYYSVDKERAAGDHHNLVRVVEHHLELDRAQAAARVAADIGRRVDDFLEAERRLSGRPECPREVEVYLEAMRSWMRGNLDWSMRTPRYGADGATDAASSGAGAGRLEPATGGAG
jgi:hypothetical protein